MILAKSTSGNLELDSFLAHRRTALWVLKMMQAEFPQTTFKYVENAESHVMYHPDDVIPDNATVFVVSDQPVDL